MRTFDQNSSTSAVEMEEHGHISFLKERYELTDCKASFFRNNVHFQCEGPDILFSFSKLRIRGAADASVYQDFSLSSERDDGDLGDYARFTFFEEDYEFDDPWEVTCVMAKPDQGVMAFEWNFVVPYGTSRIPKRKRMRGVARCSLTIHS
ncbi:MAG: hypothetical protein AB8B91_12810 [Rubripirellula sp.]